MYRQRELHFPKVREVWQYHDQRCGAPGQKRKKRGKEARDVRNQRQKERKCRWRLRQHFRAGDTYATFTCRKELRPSDMDEMRGRWTAFINAVRKDYKEAGIPFQWIRNIEVGSKGAWHIHAVLHNLGRDMAGFLQDAWPWGRVKVEALYEDGWFGELAAYLTKTPRTDKRLAEADHSSSRNMLVPEPVEKVMRRWETFDGQDVKMVPKGWYVDPDSVEEYVTPCGFPVRRFQLFRIEDRDGRTECSNETGKGRKQKLVNPSGIKIPEHSVELPEDGGDREDGREAKTEPAAGTESAGETRENPAPEYATEGAEKTGKARENPEATPEYAKETGKAGKNAGDAGEDTAEGGRTRHSKGGKAAGRGRAAAGRAKGLPERRIERNVRGRPRNRR